MGPIGTWLESIDVLSKMEDQKNSKKTKKLKEK